MKSRIPAIISGLVLATATSAAIVKPAQAGPFDFLNNINNTINQVNGAINGVKDTQSNANNALSGLTNLLGIGGSNSNSGSAASAANDIRDIYANWYGNMSAAEKEVVRALVNDFAEDKVTSFADFKKTSDYSRLTPQAKDSASSIFFKFSEVTKAAKPQKDSFLAFAFCMNGGSKKCK
jgi:hypothetical protein